MILLTVSIVLLIRKRFSHALHTTWGKTGCRAKVFFGALAALLAILVPFDRAMSRLAPALAQSQLTSFLLTAGMYLSAAAICFVLLPFPLVCICCFACGMSFRLATCNVFFRDTKFLWGIITMLWMYLTPLFYPETIIPAGFLTLHYMNPLYQFIYFLRCIVIEGVTRQPIIYLYGLLGIIIPLLVGILVFSMEQHKFVMHL